MRGWEGRGKCWGRVGGEDKTGGGGLGEDGRVSMGKYEDETSHTSRMAQEMHRNIQITASKDEHVPFIKKPSSKWDWTVFPYSLSEVSEQLA